ncbi:class I SAM-dependent methyltransferase [Haloparvum sp. AD34]
MKKSVEEHAERFSAKAAEYDESKTDEYHACANLAIEHASPNAGDVVLDLGAGTGAIGLALAPDADRVVLRDVSAGMLEQAREKIADRELDNVETAEGTFREPDYAGPADVIVSNFALHHLSDAEKREAIEVMADYAPRRIVLGDVMFFGSPDPAAEFYSPEVDDPSTVGHLVDCFTDVGYAVTAVERVHDQVGVLVAERRGGEDSGE